MKILFLSFIIVVTDQVSKYIVIRTFAMGETLRVLPFFHLTLVTNTGTAFGLFQGANILFIIVTVLIIGFLLFWKKTIFSYGTAAQAGYALVLGGGVGNLIDRVIHREVIDFLDFLVWPVFNIADTAVCVGTMLMLIIMFKTDRKRLHASDSL